ncbi:hypothetical protein TgHK011_007984 [Trichoderma gracile]|nr:hypothetical protein TgHK011_007984 [Trichoderma gracile]
MEGGKWRGGLEEQRVGDPAEEVRGANSSSMDRFWVRGPASSHDRRSRDPSSFELIVMCHGLTANGDGIGSDVADRNTWLPPKPLLHWGEA